MGQALPSVAWAYAVSRAYLTDMWHRSSPHGVSTVPEANV
ncbi:hypothetical protein ANO14919_000330 [Xylariales sp. No.14919]|nr:hypothetical protein ANO14919_000330 [Xylariales sp. No.14919]